jgi:hypothetical protein
VSYSIHYTECVVLPVAAFVSVTNTIKTTVIRVTQDSDIGCKKGSSNCHSQNEYMMYETMWFELGIENSTVDAAV